MHRQRKMDGTVTWRFDRVMKYLPLMLQAALIGHALPNYLSINKAAASVIVVFTSFGLLFYLLIASPLSFPIVAHSELRSPSPLAS